MIENEEKAVFPVLVFVSILFSITIMIIKGDKIFNLVDYISYSEQFQNGKYEKLIHDIFTIPQNERTFEEWEYLLKSLRKLQRIGEMEEIAKNLMSNYSFKSIQNKLNIYYQLMWIAYIKGEYNEGLLLLEEAFTQHNTLSFDELEENQIKNYIEIYNHAGVLHFAVGNYNEAMDHFKELRDLGQKIADENVIETGMINIGLIYLIIGKYDNAIDSLLEALELARRNDIKPHISVAAINLSTTYKVKGQLDEAEEYIKISLEICDKMNDDWGKAKATSGLGEIFLQRGNFNRAIELFEDALKLGQKFDNPYEISQITFYLFESYLYKGEREKATDCLRTIKSNIEKSPTERHENIYKLGEALYLKSSRLYRHKSKAEKIFRDLINKNNKIDVHILFKSFFNLAELLVEQVDDIDTNNTLQEDETKILEEIEQIYEEIKSKSSFEESIHLKIQSHYLAANIHLLNLHPQKAEKELNKATELSEESGLEVVTLTNTDITHKHFESQNKSIPYELNESINRMIHSVPRLKIIISLINEPKMTFTEIKEQAGLTPGNLGRNADKLVEAGYIDKRKEVVNDKFLTVYSLTSKGIKEFQKYSEILKPHLS